MTRVSERPSSRPDRHFVDALARGLSILEAFSRSSAPMSNGELSQMTGLAPSTVSRLTHTLVILGYLRVERGSRRYMLTPKCLNLGYPVLSHLSFLEQARPVLHRLAAETRETAALAIRDGLNATFVECVQGTSLVAVRLATGARLPIAVSAAGLSLLAQMTRQERNTLVSRIRTELNRRNGDVEAFDNRLAQALENPVVVVRDAWRKGIGGLAVAIETQGHPVALTLPVATGSVTEEDLRGPLAQAVLDAAGQLSQMRSDVPVQQLASLPRSRGTSR